MSAIADAVAGMVWQARLDAQNPGRTDWNALPPSRAARNAEVRRVVEQAKLLLLSVPSSDPDKARVQLLVDQLGVELAADRVSR